VRDGRLARVLVRSFNCPNLVSRARRTSQGAEARLLTRDEARRIAANLAKLPVNIDQTAKSKSNAQDKGVTNEDSSRRNGACEFPTRCLFGPTRTAGSGGTARRKRSERRSGSARPDGTKRRPGSTSAGLRIVSGVKTVSCDDDEVLVSVFCSAGAPDGAGCSAGITATGLYMRK
jgi:hypothetical protein